MPLTHYLDSFFRQYVSHENHYVRRSRRENTLDHVSIDTLTRRRSRKRRRKHGLIRHWSHLQSIFILIDTSQSAQVLIEITLPWSGATSVKSLNDSRSFLSRLTASSYFLRVYRSRQTKFRSLSFSQSSLSVNHAYASSELDFIYGSVVGHDRDSLLYAWPDPINLASSAFVFSLYPSHFSFSLPEERSTIARAPRWPDSVIGHPERATTSARLPVTVINRTLIPSMSHRLAVAGIVADYRPVARLISPFHPTQHSRVRRYAGHTGNIQRDYVALITSRVAIIARTIPITWWGRMRRWVSYQRYWASPTDFVRTRPTGARARAPPENGDSSLSVATGQRWWVVGSATKGCRGRARERREKEREGGRGD